MRSKCLIVLRSCAAIASKSQRMVTTANSMNTIIERREPRAIENGIAGIRGSGDFTIVRSGADAPFHSSLRAIRSARSASCATESLQALMLITSYVLRFISRSVAEMLDRSLIPRICAVFATPAIAARPSLKIRTCGKNLAALRGRGVGFPKASWRRPHHSHSRTAAAKDFFRLAR